MVNIPTTERRFYNNTGKVNTLGAISSALLPAAQDAQKTYMQQQQIKIDTNTTKARVEIDDFTNQWQLANQGNPNSQTARKEWQNGVQDILNKYGSEIDPIAGQSWNLAATKITEGYNQGLNQWALNQNAQNVKLDIADNMSTNLQRAYTSGQNGNIEQAIQDLDISFNQLSGYGNSALGSTNTRALLKDYKKNYIKNFIAGQMMTNPQAALESIGNEQIQSVFDGAGEIDELKGFALSKLAVAKQQAEFNAVFNDAKTGNDLLNKSMNGDLSLEEIQSLMPENASASYKKLIYNMNGYSTKGLNKASGSGKVSADDKALAEAELYEDFEQIAALENSKDKIEGYKKLNEKAYKYMESGYISADKGITFLNTVATPLANEWLDYGKNFKVDKEGWFSGNYGYNELINSLNLPKIKDSDKKTTSGKKQLAANARIKNDVSQLYFDYLDKELQSKGMARENLKDLSTADKRTLFSSVQDKAISAYNSGKYRELLKLKPEQQPNQILDNGDLVSNVGNVENSKQGTPINDGNWQKVGKYNVRIK